METVLLAYADYALKRYRPKMADGWFRLGLGVGEDRCIPFAPTTLRNTRFIEGKMLCIYHEGLGTLVIY